MRGGGVEGRQPWLEESVGFNLAIVSAKMVTRPKSEDERMKKPVEEQRTNRTTEQQNNRTTTNKTPRV